MPWGSGSIDKSWNKNEDLEAPPTPTEKVIMCHINEFFIYVIKNCAKSTFCSQYSCRYIFCSMYRRVFYCVTKELDFYILNLYSLGLDYVFLLSIANGPHYFWVAETYAAKFTFIKFPNTKIWLFQEPFQLYFYHLIKENCAFVLKLEQV